MRKREEPVEELVFIEEKRREWGERREERTELPDKPLVPVRREVKFGKG
jgi:hypothetical protein